MDEHNVATLIAGLAAIGFMGAGAWWIVQSMKENGACKPFSIQQMQCADGSVITVQQCQDGQWVPTGITCPNGNGGNGPPPACVTGEVQTQLCLDGSIITTKQCQNNQWVDTGVQCPQKEIALVGKVVDITDMTKIIGANIRLTGRGYGDVYIAHSDSNGQYFIGNIQSDHYDAEIKAEGYLARKHFNLDFTKPHPFLDYYDLTDVGNGLTLRMPVMIDLVVNPISVGFEGGHWCCGALTMKSRHPRITVTATVYDNDSPSRPMPGPGVIFHPNSTWEGCFFCSSSDKNGYGNLSVKSNHNGQAICYYYCKNEKDMQRFFDATIGWFWSVRGGIDISPPLKASGVIVTTGSSIVAERTCYGECEKEFKGGTSVGCVP